MLLRQEHPKASLNLHSGALSVSFRSPTATEQFIDLTLCRFWTERTRTNWSRSSTSCCGVTGCSDRPDTLTSEEPLSRLVLGGSYKMLQIYFGECPFHEVRCIKTRKGRDPRRKDPDRSGRYSASPYVGPSRIQAVMRCRLVVKPGSVVVHSPRSTQDWRPSRSTLSPRS